MSELSTVRLSLLALALGAASGCAADDDADACGPAAAVVVGVVDGDTIDLDSGERVRYLMIDTPELASADCFAQEALTRNSELVLGRKVTLTYDVECTDRYGRLLAYVSVDGAEVNRQLVDEGYACVLEIPPNGADRVDELTGLEARAKSEGRGMWSACEVVTCD